MGVSHDRNTLGPPDQAGISPIALGGPLPKRDGAWEPHEGVKPGSEPRGGLKFVLLRTCQINSCLLKFVVIVILRS